MNILELNVKKIFIFQQNYLKVDLWQRSNSEKSRVLACCITYMIFQGSAPTFHGGSPRNSLKSDIFLFGPGIFIYQMNAAYF